MILSFAIILLGIVASGSCFSLGFMSFLKKKSVLGTILIIASIALLVSMFVFIKDAPNIQSMD